MDKNYEKDYHSLEESYWWFSSRREVIIDQISNLNIDKTSKVLEVGCSGGPLLKLLKCRGYSNLHGIDISEEAIKKAKNRGIENVEVKDASNLDFNGEKFDLIIASDILEHIENDNKTLERWVELLNPNGYLIIYVPAFQFLWSKHDVYNHHYRRYSKKEFNIKLRNSGLEIVKSSFWNFFLFFPTLFIRLIKVKSNSNEYQLYKINPILNFILKFILKLEKYIIRKVNLPVGVSVFSICRKLS